MALMLGLLCACTSGKSFEDGGDGPDGTVPDGDGAHDPFWAWCPTSADYVGGDWAWTLRITPDAILCATFDETRTLEEELQVKSRMRLIPGDYSIPDQNDTYPFLLPVCFEFQTPDTHPLLDGPGQITSNHTQYQGDMLVSLRLLQPLRTHNGQAWQFELIIHSRLGPGENLIVLDGNYIDPASMMTFRYRICKETCSNYEDIRWFNSCRFDTARRERHTLVFEGGQVQLFFHMGDSVASTEPGIFRRALGALDGHTFDQENYYRLVYNPEHHHFSRDFAVLFDMPLADACGLKAENLDRWTEPPPSRITTIHCDLTEIQERKINQETWEILN